MGLREVRRAKGLTQAEAADIAQVSLASYKNHEIGRSKPDSPLGRVIFERIQEYEPYSFDRGILPLSLIREKVEETFRAKDVDFVFLFGSYAKGNPTEQSDVDLLIAGKITGLDFFALGGELERAIHKHVDVVRLNDITSNLDFLVEILSTGVKIYDKKQG